MHYWFTPLFCLFFFSVGLNESFLVSQNCHQQSRKENWKELVNYKLK